MTAAYAAIDHPLKRKRHSGNMPKVFRLHLFRERLCYKSVKEYAIM